MTPERPLKIALYTGKGASHSWIWFVDTLRSHGIITIEFITDVRDIAADVLVVSGGDPFALFSHIGREGVSRMRSFVEKGGTYIGICAGTYFALKFHDDPYPWLNLVRGEISNFAVEPPPNIRMPHKYLVRYRDGYVFHPVREAITLNYNGTIIQAPLYGGPGILSADAESQASYTNFTPKTMFLCEKEAATQALLGKKALVTKKVSRGCLYLFGPHFEHPYFPEANRELVTLLSRIPPRGYHLELTGSPITGTEKRTWVKDVKRWISNGRLAALGLQNFQWKIGEKMYDPERLAYFFQACFTLVAFLESQQSIRAIPDIPNRAQTLALQVRKLGPDANEAEIILEGIKTLTSDLYSLAFSTLQQPLPPQRP
ncbi:MAG: hypothetical protein HXS49_11905 [Theionarchaea archaeon]|nr:hypothetical protein [Theionarchaea archaeon]MBU7035887.1 hypothetical protein [Theionarchaea archaeon]